MNRVKKLINAKKAYISGLSGEGVGIAVLDTGMDAIHPDLKDRVCYFYDFINHKAECYDDNGHGTHIAGIICGNGLNCQKKYEGIAPAVHLIILKVLDYKGNGSTDYVISALNFIKKNHQKYNIRIINFSIGYLPWANISEQKKLVKLLEELWDLGIVVVTAAGNNGPNENTITVPGISRRLLTVGAIDHPFFRYSGNGPTSCCITKPEILAPGTKIISTKNDHKGYFVKTGTSMATPVVCGAIALLLEKNPFLSPEAVKLLLYETVSPIEDPIVSNAWGILNVDQLIEL